MATIALRFIAPLLLFGATAMGQRPENISICDYYTAAKFGEASALDQYHMIQGIVSLAFAGSSSIPEGNVSEKITGILNPGQEEETGTSIDLLPWFNGSRASSNLNNQPIGINWLDDGGVQPLLDYLSGKTANVTLRPETNEFRLFGHFFIAFSRVFGCSSPFPPLPGKTNPVSLAFAHKFMDLNNTQLSYFIDQLTMSAEHFGFSEADANTINQSLNSRYNVRCAPAVSFSPNSKPQLLSLCQHPSCPLAVPNADCAAYVNLTAEGTNGDTNTVAPSSLAPTTITTGFPADQLPTETPTPSPSAAPAAPATQEDSKVLSAGGIAGVAVGGAAVLIALLAVILWYKKRNRKSNIPESVGPSTTTAVSEWATDPKSPYAQSDAGGGNYFNGQGGGYSTPPAPASPGWGPGGIGASGVGMGGFGGMSPGYGGSEQHGSWQWTPAPPRAQSPRAEMPSPEMPPMSPQEMAGEGFDRERRMSPLSR